MVRIWTLEDTFSTNLRRLLYFHHATGKEAAQALGVAHHTLSSWLTGKRRPGSQGLIAIDKVYGVSPRELELPLADFAQLLADRERMAHADKNLRVFIDGKPEHVVPLRRRRR